MNILYEEDGGFKFATIVSDQTTSLQVDTQHGKRSKVKAAAVLLRFNDPIAAVHDAAQAYAADIDIDFLWQCCGPDEFGFDTLAAEYFGHAASPAEAAAVLFRLHNAPMYFYKKGKGRYRAAPEDALKAALASEERKRRQAEEIAAYVEELDRGQLPQAFVSDLERLIFQPDKQSLAYKALERVAATQHSTPLRVLVQCGALGDIEHYHRRLFERTHFPDGTDFAPTPTLPPLPELPAAEVAAFSIDDSETTEIDDAFSLTRNADGSMRIGVHIAAPALQIGVGSPLDEVALKRLSTVYMPGDKITMLPQSLIERFTLQAGGAVPALSLYLDVDAETFAISHSETRVERVPIVANLRHQEFEPLFNETTIAAGLLDFDYANELLWLWRFASDLEKKRQAAGANVTQFRDYNFFIDDGRVTISERQRGSPLDKLVAELMILVNSHWAAQLAREGVAAIHRVQDNAKVRLSLEPGAHQGLGVANYMWASSPLRRAIDLLNQRQLIALVSNELPPYAPRSPALATAMRDFELAYDAYNAFQRSMERYWCLRYLEQEKIETLDASVLRESLIRVETLPLVLRVPSLPQLDAGARVRVRINRIDYLELECACKYEATLDSPAAAGATPQAC